MNQPVGNKEKKTCLTAHCPTQTNKKRIMT